MYHVLAEQMFPNQKHGKFCMLYVCHFKNIITENGWAIINCKVDVLLYLRVSNYRIC